MHVLTSVMRNAAQKENQRPGRNQTNSQKVKVKKQRLRFYSKEER
jgi:hypothetical protein